MSSFGKFSASQQTIPMITSWELSELAEMKGKQQLFTRQSPQKLKRMIEFAAVESSLSSNRIEGVSIDDRRVGTVLFGNNALKDRNEEEVRGYRRALELIHVRGRELPLSLATVRRLHELSHPDAWDSGTFKQKANDIIEKYPDGTSRVRFQTVPPERVESDLSGLIEAYETALRERKIPSLIAIAAFNLDFLCIHPFRDGNGRVSRLLLLLMFYQAGYEAGRYVSIEKMIEDTKAQYYETLELSSRNWHSGDHDLWPYINYLLFVLRNVYREFEIRFEETAAPRGAKRETVIRAINDCEDVFTLRELEKRCPGVGKDTIRLVLKQASGAGHIAASGHGRGSFWRRIRVLPLL